MTKPNKQKILIVDDENDIIELLSYNLLKEGFDVSSASDGEEALKKIRNETFDLAVLDLMLPGLQGMELCRMLRNDPKTESLPVIMLTAKAEELDRILGLEMGADDYITKPFSPRELVSRVKAVLRRTNEKPIGGKVIRIGDLVVNTETYSVLKRDIPLNLSSTEFKLLLYLIEKRGRSSIANNSLMPYGKMMPLLSRELLMCIYGDYAPKLRMNLQVPYT